MLNPITLALTLVAGTMAPDAAPAPGDAAPAGEGDTLLRALDAHLARTRDQVVTMEMAVADPGHDPRRIGLQMHMRGEKRRIAFLYPGDMKGMRVLNLSDTQSYVYLPAFGKVRRVASHVRAQSMFGSDYALTDLASLSLAGHYTGRVIAQDATMATVRADPRPGDTAVAPGHLEVVIDKARHVATELRFYAADGTHARTETREDFSCKDEVCVPRRTKMVDHRHDDHWTEITLKDLQVNSDFSNDVFSLRALQRQD